MMMMMMRMVVRFYLLFSLLSLLGLTVAGQEEAFELIHLHEPSPVSAIAVSVTKQELSLLSSTVLAAETWLKSHVLAHYPSTNITTILVGNHTLCNKSFENQWSLVLPSAKNLYYSLARWGLLKEIKVSAAFSSACFEASDAQETVKSLLSFLQESYTVESLGLYRIREVRMMKIARPMTRKLYSLDFQSRSSAHQEFLKSLGFSRLRDIRTVRKLSSLRSSPPPSPQFAPVPGSSFTFAPEATPVLVPASPPDVSAESPWPFCLPPLSGPAPAAGEGEKVGLWCVAKPTVPAEKLQEGIDFACGEGGADCEEIRPNGNCFNPDNLVAHASYAFNSYWQKTKQSGGFCNFDGTALLITSDPSFQRCRFELIS